MSRFCIHIIQSQPPPRWCWFITRAMRYCQIINNPLMGWCKEHISVISGTPPHGLNGETVRGRLSHTSLRGMGRGVNNGEVIVQTFINSIFSFSSILIFSEFHFAREQRLCFASDRPVKEICDMLQEPILRFFQLITARCCCCTAGGII